MSEEELIFPRKATGLVKEFSMLDVLIFFVAGPAASGVLFYSVNTLNEYQGANIAFTFLIGGLLIFPMMVTIALLSSALPRSGGIYVAMSRILNPQLSVLVTWMKTFQFGVACGVLGYIASTLLGSAVAIAGQLTNNSLLVDMGLSMGSTTGGIVGALLWIMFFWAATLLSTASVRIIERILFVIPLVATVIAMFFFLIVGPNGSQSAFDNTWGTGTYQLILNTARGAGWSSPGFSLTASISALLVVIWAYQGYENITYAGGEIRNPKRSILLGAVIGFTCLILLYVVIGLAIGYTFGDFLNAYDFLSDNKLLKTPMPRLPPSVPFFAGSIVPFPWLSIIVVVGIAFWFINSIPTIFVAASRNYFAMGFDRAFPEKLCEISRRGSPTWATHITALSALFGVYLISQRVTVLLGAMTILAWTAYWLFGIAAMLFPYIRPELYERTYIAKWKVGKIPVITILGAFTFAGAWFIVLFAATQIIMETALAITMIALLGLIVFVWQQSRNAKARIDTTRIYSQIPPE